MQREGKRMFISQKSKVAQIGCQVRLQGGCVESDKVRSQFRDRAKPQAAPAEQPLHRA